MSNVVNEFANLYCEICDDTGDEFLVHGYCTNCNQYMCKNCFEYHSKPKPTRHHVLKAKSEMPKPTERPVAAVSADACVELCTRHSTELATFYCETHDEFFCNSCAATTHRTCIFVYIPDAAKDFANSSELEKIFAELNNISKRCEENIDRAMNNTTKSSNQLASGKRSVDSYIESVRKHLNEKAEKFYSKMEEINKDNKSQMEAVADISKTTKTHSDETKTNLKNLCDKKQYCQLYTETKKAAKVIKQLDETAEKAISDNKIQEFKSQIDKRLFQCAANSSLFICIDPNDKKRLFPIYQSVMVSNAEKGDNDIPLESAPGIPGSFRQRHVQEADNIPEPRFPPPAIPPRKNTLGEIHVEEEKPATDEDAIYELIEDKQSYMQ